MSSGVNYSEIIDKLMPAAFSCDARLDRARPINPDMVGPKDAWRSILPVEPGKRDEFSFYTEALTFTTYEIDSEVKFGARIDWALGHQAACDYLCAWAVARGWGKKVELSRELGPYLDYRQLLFAIGLEAKAHHQGRREEQVSTSVIENLEQIPGGGSWAPSNYRFEISERRLVDVCDATLPDRSVGWLKIFDLFLATENGHGVGRGLACVIADSFEKVADEVPMVWWQILVELAGVGGCKAKFTEVVPLLAGMVVL